MSRHNHNLDDLIDRAVRDVMHVDAEAGFEARVAGRIGRQAPAIRWPRLALAGAAGVALVVSLLLIRLPGPDRIEPAVLSVRPEPGTVIEPVPQLVGRTDSGKGAAEPPARLRSRGAVSSQRAATLLPPMSTDEGLAGRAIGVGPPLEIEALTPIEPIDVPPLHTSAIAPQDVVIAPLAPIADVHIEPLSLTEE